jgi:WD40 repeat protein
MTPLFRVDALHDEIGVIDFSPDGSLMLVDQSHPDAGQSQIQLWSVPEVEVVETIQGDPVRCVDTASSFLNEKTLAVSYESSENHHELHLWKVRPLTLEKRLAGHQLPIQQFAISADGETLVTAAFDWLIKSQPELRVWDVASGQLKGSFAVPNIDSVEFAPDGRTFLVDESDRIVRRSTEDGKVVDSLKLRCEDDSSWGHVTKWCFLDDGTIIVALGRRFSRSMSTVFFFGEGILKVVEFRTGAEWAPLKNLGKGYCGMEFSPDGQLLAAASADGSMKLWNVRSGELTTFPLEGTSVLLGKKRIPMLGSVRFSNDSKYLAWDRDLGFKVWDLETERLIADETGIGFGSFSPIGNHFSTYRNRLPVDSTYSAIWDLPSGKRRPFVRW